MIETCFLLCIALDTPTTSYPETLRENVNETIHGIEVQDPYRWLEDDVRESDNVRNWVTEENKVTKEYLDSIESLPSIRDALTKAWNYPKQGKIISI